MPGGYEWLIIIAVLLLLFGAKKLPEMARSVGQSARVFKGEMKGLKDDEAKAKNAPESAESKAAPENQAPAAPQELPAASQTPADPAPQAAQPQDRGTANSN